MQGETSRQQTRPKNIHFKLLALISICWLFAALSGASASAAVVNCPNATSVRVEHAASRVFADYAEPVTSACRLSTGGASLFNRFTGLPMEKVGTGEFF